MNKNQKDLIYYTQLFKNDYDKGVRALEQILLDQNQKEAFVKNPAGVSVIFSFDRTNPDGNAVELYDMLATSGCVDEAAKTCLSQYVDFNSENFGDDVVTLMEDYNKEVLNSVFSSDIIINELKEYDSFNTYKENTLNLRRDLTYLSGLNEEDYINENNNLAPITTSYIAISAIASSPSAWNRGLASNNFTEIGLVYGVSSAVAGKSIANLIEGLNPDDITDMIDIPTDNSEILKEMFNTNSTLNIILYTSSAMDMLCNDTYAVHDFVENDLVFDRMLKSYTAINAYLGIVKSATIFSRIFSDKNLSNGKYEKVLSSKMAVKAMSNSNRFLIQIFNNEERGINLLYFAIQKSETWNILTSTNLFYETCQEEFSNNYIAEIIYKLFDKEYVGEYSNIFENGIVNNDEMSSLIFSSKEALNLILCRITVFENFVAKNSNKALNSPLVEYVYPTTSGTRYISIEGRGILLKIVSDTLNNNDGSKYDIDNSGEYVTTTESVNDVFKRYLFNASVRMKLTTVGEDYIAYIPLNDNEVVID